LSRQVIWKAQAIDQAAGFLRDRPDGVREMLDAVARDPPMSRAFARYRYSLPARYFERLHE
jgi:hypothetical protein